MQAAVELRAVDAWQTYPLRFLRTVVAHSIIDFGSDFEVAATSIEDSLQENLGRQRAFVGFWGFHLTNGVVLDFGTYRLQQLGPEGYDREIIEPFRAFRGTDHPDLSEDVARIEKNTDYLRNVPVLIVDYEGAAEGAKDTVRPVAEHVAEFVQFLLAPSWRSRDDVKIIDHRGGYHGRFSTVMPVLSLDNDALDLPDVRENPWGGEIGKKQMEVAAHTGILDLLPAVPRGPSKTDSLTDMLLRAIQLFADGERATSQRQAIVSYIGACEALFGHRRQAEQYTCTGIALCLGHDFDAAYRAATALYGQRSRATHQGISPDGIGEARRAAYRSIDYVLRHKAELHSKKAIRRWIEGNMTRQKSIWNRIRERVLNTIRRIARMAH